MKAIVTGGAGFIGSHLVDLLVKKKYKVIVIDNFSTGRASNLAHLKNKIIVKKVDISKIGKWKGLFEGADIVFHLAAQADIVPSIKKPKSYFNSNVTGTINILELCVKNNIKKIVYAASSSCYGIPKNYPTKETSKVSPEYPYALTKLIGEELVMHWSKVYNLSAVSLRFFNVFGTRSRTSGTYGAVLGVFLKQKLSNSPFTIVGNGSQKRDFTYVTDIANALYLASRYKKTDIFNVGSGKPHSINYLVKLLGGNKIFIPKRPGEPDITHANITKIKRELSWKPKVSFENGIKKVLKNINYWNDAPLWTPQKISKATQDWFKYLKD